MKVALTGLPFSSVPHYLYVLHAAAGGIFSEGNKVTSPSCFNSLGSSLLHLQQNPDSYTADGASIGWPTNISAWCLPFTHDSQSRWLLSVPLMAKGVKKAPTTQQDCMLLARERELALLFFWPDWGQERSFSLSGVKAPPETCSQKIGLPAEGWLWMFPR